MGVKEKRKKVHHDRLENIKNRRITYDIVFEVSFDLPEVAHISQMCRKQVI